jgi:hypothetical protein
MIVLRQAQDERAVWARLTAKAEKLGQAHVESRLRRRRRDPLRWRLPGLLWPLIAKER